jgi:hypothetical protein
MITVLRAVFLKVSTIKCILNALKCTQNGSNWVLNGHNWVEKWWLNAKMQNCNVVQLI